MRNLSHKGIKKILILGTAVVMVLLYTVYSYNKLKGESYIQEPIFISIKASMPEYAKLELLYQTINDPTKNISAARIFHDSIPENTIIFEIDSSYRLANFSIYFQLLRENDDLILEHIKATNIRQNEFNFSLKTKDLVPTENLELIPINNGSIILKKITKNDPHGAALYFTTQGSLGDIFVSSGLRIPERPSVAVILVIFVLGLLIAYHVFPVIARLEWKGISAGAILLAIAILFIPTGEQLCNLLIAMAIVAGFISSILEGKLLNRLRENRSIMIPIIIVVMIYLVSLLSSGGDSSSVKLLKIKFGLPMTLMAVALNTNSKKELQIQFIALLTGVIISVFTHLGWAFILFDAVEVKSKLFSLPQFYLESSVFSRIHHSYLSIIYLISLILVLFLRDSLKLCKKEIFIFSLLIVAGLLLAFSRAAIMAMAIILIYYVIRKIFSLIRIEIGHAARISAALILATTLLLFVLGDFNTISVNTHIKGLETRMDIWELASDLVKQKPLAGWGPGAYKDALNLGNQSGSFNINTWNVLNTHNQFLETSGMFGLLTALALVCLLFFPSGFAKQDPVNTDITLTIAIIFISVFLFESFLNRNLGVLVFGLSYGLLIKITAESTPYKMISGPPERDPLSSKRKTYVA